MTWRRPWVSANPAWIIRSGPSQISSSRWCVDIRNVFTPRLQPLDIARRDPLARLRAYVRLIAVNYAIERRLYVRVMFDEYADGLPDDVTEAVAHFFEINLTWLAAASADAL